MFVLRSRDPVDSRVVPYSIVSRVDHDDFVILEGSILSDPIAVQHSKSSQSSTSSLLGLSSKISGWLELIDTD